MGEGVHVERSRSEIDRGCARESNFGKDRTERAVTRAEVRGGRGGCRPEVRLPQQTARSAGVDVRIKRVNGIVLGSDKNHIARAFARKAQARYVERLRVDVPIYAVGKQAAK